MAALHPAETTLRQATTAANQAVAESTALVHYGTSKVKVPATGCSNHKAGRSSVYQVAVILVGM